MTDHSSRGLLGAARRAETALAWMLMAPALTIVAVVALFPVAWTIWESLHVHDLRMPWMGRPFVGGRNYVEAIGDARFWAAIGHSAFFAAAAVTLELFGGLFLALALHREVRGRGLLRTAALLPWAIPTVVVALIWRFLFESPGGLASAVLRSGAVEAPTWFADAAAAWVPLILADVWKTTPFVALLLLAGLQNIDGSLYDAARMDGAGRWRLLVHITLPMLVPALVVAGIFRSLDAFRVFDLVYVLTGGGPGTATEPIALYTFTTLLRNLHFGFGAALSTIVFGVALCFALMAVRLVAGDPAGERTR